MSYGIGPGTFGATGLGCIFAEEIVIQPPPEEPPIPPTGTGLQVVIAGIDRSGIVDLESIEIVDELNARNSASLSLRDKNNDVFLEWGSRIDIHIDSVLVFAGIVDEITEEVADQTDLKTIVLECVDFNALADRHVVATKLPAGRGLFTNVEEIVRIYSGDLNETLLAAGVTIQGTVPLTPTLGTLVFNNTPVSKAFDDLAELTGYEWNIDYRKVLHFYDRSSNRAPFPLDEKTFRGFSRVRVRKGSDQYRNVQYIRAGYDVTSQPRTDRFKGDGEVRNFDLVLELAETPVTISINGVPVDPAQIGVREKDKNKQWFYQIGERGISQDSGQTALTSSQTLEVVYKGRFPILQQGRDEVEIAARKAIEGGVGVYVDIQDETDLNDADLAEEKVTALLRRFAKVADGVSYRTKQTGLAAGMIQATDLPEYHLSGDFLITSVRIAFLGYRESSQVWTYQVESTSGEFVGGWSDFFKKWGERGRIPTIRENEQLLLLRQFFDQWGVTDTLDLEQPLGTFFEDVGHIQAGGPWCGGHRQFSDDNSDPAIAYGPLVGYPPNVGVS